MCGQPALHVEGAFKLKGREVCANISLGQPGTLGFIQDIKTKQQFLVDTGSVYSIIPYKSDAPPTGPRIIAADKTPIACWGWHQQELCVKGHMFRWNFLLAAVATPIVGADFLESHHLQVDLAKRRLLHDSAQWWVPLQSPPPGSCFAAIGVQPAEPPHVPPAAQMGCPAGVAAREPPHMPPAAQIRCQAGVAAMEPPHVPPAAQMGCPAGGAAMEPPHVPPAAQMGGPEGGAAMEPPHVPSAATVSVAAVFRDYSTIMAKFPEVLNPSKQLPPVKHHVQHHIHTEGNAVAGKYRRLDPDRLEAARKEFAELERQGVLRRSKSHWASPLHLVKKADGTWRPCGDFRRLNLQTKADRYTCPNMADLTARLAGCTVFSKLDLRKGYHQVPVKPEDIHKTAIITPFGLF